MADRGSGKPYHEYSCTRCLHSCATRLQLYGAGLRERGGAGASETVTRRERRPERVTPVSRVGALRLTRQGPHAGGYVCTIRTYGTPPQRCRGRRPPEIQSSTTSFLCYALPGPLC